jgi:hypothetical protein
MLLVPDPGASVKVNVLPLTEYATVGSCVTFSTTTSISVGDTTCLARVNAQHLTEGH